MNVLLDVGYALAKPLTTTKRVRDLIFTFPLIAPQKTAYYYSRVLSVSHLLNT